MHKSIHFGGILALLCMASGALTLAAYGEEVTVTVPPDSVAQQPQKATAAPLPSFTGGDKLKTSVAAENTATDQGAAPNSPPPATTAVKHKPKDKKPDAAAGTTADANAASSDPAANGGAAPTDKTKQATAAPKPSPCKGLDEATCGGNKLCSWVVPKVTTPDASGKAPQARCRSLAALKKENAKTAKASQSEVLPWAPKASSTETGSTTGAATTTAPAGDANKTKAATKVTKTAAVKKTTKPKEGTAAAPPVPPASDSAPAAPAEPTAEPAAPPASDPQ